MPDNTKKQKSSLSKAIIFYGLSIVLMKGLSLIMLPLIAGYLSPSALGQLELLTTAAILASLFVAMGLEDCLFRFASNTQGHAQQKIVASLYAWALIIGFIALIIGAALAPMVSALSQSLLSDGILERHHLQMVWAGVALEGAISLPLAYLRMRDNAGHFFCVVIGRTFLQALLTFIFLQHDASITSVLLASLIATCSQAIILGIIQYKSTGIRPQKQELKSIYQYGLPLLGSGLCLFALNGVDRMAIAHWVGLTELGLYAVAAKFALATVLLMQPFGMWWRPKRFEWLKNTPIACGKMLERAILLLAIITCSVACLGPILIAVLMPPNYIIATQWIGALALMLAIREASEVLNLGLLNQKNTLLLLKINIASALLATTTCLIATSLWGVIGCMSGLILVQSIRLVMIIFYGKKMLKQQNIHLPIRGSWLLFCFVVVSLCVFISPYVLTYAVALSLHSNALITLSVSLSFNTLWQACLALGGLLLITVIMLITMAVYGRIVPCRLSQYTTSNNAHITV